MGKYTRKGAPLVTSHSQVRLATCKRHLATCQPHLATCKRHCKPQIARASSLILKETESPKIKVLKRQRFFIYRLARVVAKLGNRRNICADTRLHKLEKHLDEIWEQLVKANVIHADLK